MIEAAVMCVGLGFLMAVLVPTVLWVLEMIAKGTIWVLWQFNKAHGSTQDPWGDVR